MEHAQINTPGIVSPMVQTILGTKHQSQPNFMALAWITHIQYKPSLIALSVNHAHESHKAITKTNQFSICYPSRNLLGLCDAIGLVSARDADKSKLFDVFYGELENAPMIRQCPLCVEYTLHSTVDFDTNSLFIGQLRAVWATPEILTNGQPDVTRIKPFLLSMPDGQYHLMGNPAGKAWNKDNKKLLLG